MLLIILDFWRVEPVINNPIDSTDYAKRAYIDPPFYSVYHLKNEKMCYT